MNKPDSDFDDIFHNSNSQSIIGNVNPAEFVCRCDNCKCGNDYMAELEAADITCTNETIKGYSRFEGFYPLKSFSCSLWSPK